MKIFTFILGLFLINNLATAQVISISDARNTALGATVTVKGIVTNGSEFGAIRYMQDNTAGIAAYSTTQLATVNRGDSIEITGVLKNYNNLLELDPVTSVTVINSGNPLPQPINLSLTLGFVEAYESMLVRFDSVSFALSGNFAGNTNYNITKGLVSKQFRSVTGTNLIGTPIPIGVTNISGIMSQFSTTYQCLGRDLLDLNVGSVLPIFTTDLLQTDITVNSFKVSFTTQNVGTTILQYGLSPSTLGAPIVINNLTKNHLVQLTGLNHTTFYYLKAASVSATGDTSFSGIRLMSTASISSGSIKAYFNKPVNNAYSQGQNAVYSYFGLDDTIINYINRSVSTLDIMMYNWNNSNLSSISNAVNAAYTRGVAVRVISDGGSTNVSINSLNPAIKVLKSPTAFPNYTIMHNKIVIIDANSPNPNVPLIITGSTNWTEGQMNTDPNNMMILQDQAIANAYTMEFEEMWGSNTLVPNSALAKFGQFKTDNTPHKFMVAGKLVEVYFSPSDNTEQAIINAIGTANKDIEIAVFQFTRTSIANEIKNRTFVTPTVFAGGIINDTTNASAPFLILKNNTNGMGGNFFLSTQPGIFHHKYCIIDQNDPFSDPQVVTGSHNWSSSANTKNDENTVIVHDATMANVYFQEWVKRYTDQGGSVFYTGIGKNIEVKGMVDPIYPNPTENSATIKMTLDKPELAIINVFDILGKLVVTKSISATQGINLLNIPIENLNSGLYMIQLSVNNWSNTQKLKISK